MHSDLQLETKIFKKYSLYYLSENIILTIYHWLVSLSWHGKRYGEGMSSSWVTQIFHLAKQLS